MTWYLLVLASAVLMALASVIRKRVLGHEHAMETLATESVFRILIMLLFVPFIRLPHGAEWILVLIAATVQIATGYYRLRAYRHMPISVVAPMHNLSPAVLLVLAIVVLGEQPTGVQFLGIVLLVLGGYALEMRDRDPLTPFRRLANQKYLPVIAAMLVLLSVLGIIDKIAVSRFALPVLTWYFWSHLLSSMGAVSIQVTRYGIGPLAHDLRADGLWLGMAAIFATVNILLLFSAIALPGVAISLAIPLRRTATLMETFLGGRLFHEEHLLQKALACAVMLAGVVLIV